MRQEQFSDINQRRSLTGYFCDPWSGFNNNNCNFMVEFVKEDL